MFAVYAVEILFFLITSIIYIIVLSIMWKGWISNTTKLNVPFFKLCFITGVCDLLTLMNNNIGNVLPKACAAEGVYRFLGAPYLHLYFFIAWGGGVCQGFCATVIAFNRFFTLLYPHLSLRLYSNPWLLCSFAIQLIPGIIAGAITLTVTVSWWQGSGECALVGWIENEGVTRTYFSVAAVFLVLTAVIIIGIYSVILFNIKKTHKQQIDSINTFDSRQNNIGLLQFKRESRLFTMSFIICAVQVFYTFYLILRELTGIDENYIGLTFLSDVCAGTNAYLLLAFSKPIRYHFTKLLTSFHPSIAKIGGGLDARIPVALEQQRTRSPATTVIMRHS